MDRMLDKVTGDQEPVRLNGHVPEMATEVLLQLDGEQFAVCYETRSISSAINNARQEFPGAAVLQARRVLVISEEERGKEEMRSLNAGL